MNLDELGWCDDATQALASLAREGFTVGRVALAYRGVYRLYTEQGELPATVAGQLRYQAQDLAALPAVGDWVAVRLHGGETQATIHQVLPRRSQFVRKMAGTKTEAQVIAANVDTVFLISGLDGDFNLRRIERSQVLAWESGAAPVIVLNKADHCEDLESALAAVAAVALGVPVLPISALTGEGLEALVPYLEPGKTVALIGSSGVGKSTLTNALLGEAVQRTQAVRAEDQRGRHTTTHRHLLQLPTGAWLIDTPGLRELQLWSPQAGLAETFADLEALAEQCRFRDCQHQGEPGCAVQAAIAAGSLDPARLRSYQKLQREQRHLAERQAGQASLNTKRRWKTIHQAMRHHPKRG